MLLKKGAYEEAAKLVPLAESARKQKMMQQLQGLTPKQMRDPEVLDRLGASGIPGTAHFTAQAERLRTQGANAAQMKLGQQAEQEFPKITGTEPTEAAAIARLQEAAKHGQVGTVTLGPKADTTQPGATGTAMTGGLYSWTNESTDPAIRTAGRVLQGQMNRADAKTIPVKWFEDRNAELLKKQADFEQARGMAAQRVADRPPLSLTTQGELDPEAIKDLAIQSLYDPNALAGYRRDPKMMSKIANERVKLMRESGVTSEDVVSGRAGFKADTASLNKITPQYDAITAFEKTAIRNGKILIELADKVDTTGVPVLERWIRAGRKSIAGDTDVAKFEAQMNLYRAEAARILTQPNLTGVLTDTARKEMEEVIRNSASAKQVREVVNLLERDFNNRKETLEEQIGAIRSRMRGRVAPGSPTPATGNPTPSPAAAKVVDFGSLK